jgi:hypothetical protein
MKRHLFALAAAFLASAVCLSPALAGGMPQSELTRIA